MGHLAELPVRLAGEPLVPAGSRADDQTAGSERDQWERSAAGDRRHQTNRAVDRLGAGRGRRHGGAWEQ